MLLILIPLTLLVHNSLAYSLYDDIDDYHLWADESSVATASNQGCKKDLLILWDCSSSIGFTDLKNSIIPFLEGLVNSSKLNVNEEGTHLGFITFSKKEKTKVLKKVGEMRSPDELRKWLDQYTKKSFFRSTYKTKQLGTQTYTGEALIRANEEFAKQGPLNHREDVADVILLFTDGKPNPNSGTEDQTTVALKYSTILKEKNVKIFGLAAGTERNLKQYSPLIEKWSSKPSTEYFFKSDISNLDRVVDNIVGPLCGPAAGE